MSRTIVLKFGSSVLRSAADLPAVTREITLERAAGCHVVAVVSAFEGVTDDLLKRAQQLGLPPQPRATAALLATGEATSGALLTVCLTAAGIPATLLDAAQLSLTSRGDALDAEPATVDETLLARTLVNSVVVVPGFVARDEKGRPAVFGRGGSDLTALFLAKSLGADCRLIKDVDGLYTADPNVEGFARRYATATWGTVLRLGTTVVQPKAVTFARDAGLEFGISALAPSRGTRVGRGPDLLAANDNASGDAAEEGVA